MQDDACDYKFLSKDEQLNINISGTMMYVLLYYRIARFRWTCSV
jgi:hypothetical protein